MCLQAHDIVERVHDIDLTNFSAVTIVKVIIYYM